MRRRFYKYKCLNTRQKYVKNIKSKYKRRKNYVKIRKYHVRREMRMSNIFIGESGVFFIFAIYLITQLYINEMESISSYLRFFLNLTMTQGITARRFDARLSSHSIGLNDFMILFHLNQAPEERLRRIDLAEKIGLSASGVTRMLAPLEKLGMVKREANKRDARVSYVKLTKAGKRILTEAMGSAEMTASELYPKEKEEKLEDATKVLIALGGSVK